METVETLILRREDVIERSIDKATKLLDITDFKISARLLFEHPIILFIDDNGDTTIMKNRFGLIETPWTRLNKEVPTVEENGERVLIYRISNDSQKNSEMSIFETSMVKHCEPNETWWKKLPNIPNN